MSDPRVTVTVTYQRGDMILVRHHYPADAAKIVYDAPVPVVLHDDDFGTTCWYGYDLTNGVRHREKRVAS